PDADRRQLRLAPEAPHRPRAPGPGRGARRGRARGSTAAREARLPRLQDLGQVEPRADDDPCLPDAVGEGAVSAPPRSHRGGHDVGFVYAHGRVLKKVPSDVLIDTLFDEIDKWIADGMNRPKRLKMAKPAALAMAEASLIPLE